MSLIESLSEEVLLIIFEQFNTEGRPSIDLKTLRLVSSRFCPIASSLLFRRIALRFPEDAIDTLERYENLDRSKNLLAFLSQHERIRAQVQIISLYGHFNGHGIEDVSGHLTRLLPLFPRLKTINISQIGTTKSPSGSSSSSPFLEGIQDLAAPVMLCVGKHRLTGGVIHTFNPHLFLNKVTCLESFQVKLLNTPNFPRHGEETYRTFDGYPSQEIATILRQNSALKDLHLQLAATNHGAQAHELLSAEKEHALENIGEAVHSLRSLALEGEFQFTQKAWSIWETNFNWARLRKLTLLSESLTKAVTTKCIGKCSELRTLRLETLSEDSNLHEPNVHRFQTDVNPFLTSVTLTELSLIGFHPNNLKSLGESGSRLRRLAFHIREGPQSWSTPGVPRPRSIRTPPKYTDMLLSPNQLRDLQGACPSLQWLAIDVLHFHLSKDTERLLPPFAGLPPSTVEEAVNNTQAATNNLQALIARTILAQFSVPKDTPDPVFATLTQFRSLRHLRLYIHRILRHFRTWTASVDDMIRTFLWLRENKKGVPLESLVILPEPHYPFWPYIVYEMGSDKVYAEHEGRVSVFEIQKIGGKFSRLRELRRENIATTETPSDYWERVDPEGWIVPISWM